MLYKCKFFKLCPWLQDEADKQRTQEQALIQKNNLKEEISQDPLTLFKRSQLLKREPNQGVEKGRLLIRA